MTTEGLMIGGACLAFGLLVAGNARWNHGWYTDIDTLDLRVTIFGRDLVRRFDMVIGAAFALAGIAIALGAVG